MKRHRRLRIAAATGAVALLASGLGVGTAAAAVTIPVRPYVFGSIGVGSTNPGDPENTLCLVFADDPTSYGGLINGAPGGAPGELNVTLLDGEEFAAGNTVVVPTCVPTQISVATDDAATFGQPGVNPAKPGGKLTVGLISSLQPGLQATGQTTLRVNYDGANGQYVKLPAKAAVVGGALTGADHVDLKMKPFLIKTKPALDATACSDNQYVVDTNDIVDEPRMPSPRAWPIDSTDPAAKHVGDSGTYVATIRVCAQLETSVPGKTVKNVIIIVGAGDTSVEFLGSSTVNPQTWDTTRGKVCKTVKTAGDFGDVLDSSRILQCKGNYGDPIPFGIDVRNWIDDTPGELDTYGLNHPGNPVETLSFTFPPAP